MFAAANDSSGAYVLLFVVAMVVVLWPLYRWALGGLGYFFVVFGAVGLAVSLIDGAASTEPAVLLAGGVLLRLTTRSKRRGRRDRQRTRLSASNDGSPMAVASGERRGTLPSIRFAQRR